MKLIPKIILVFLLSLMSIGLNARPLQQQPQNRTGSAANDAAFTGLSTSMIGWGIGLAAGIAIVAGVIHQSREGGGGASHAHCN